MKNKIFKTSYFGFMSMAVAAPTAHAAIIPGEKQSSLVSQLSASLLFDQTFDDAPVLPFESAKGPTPWAQRNTQTIKTETWPQAYVATNAGADVTPLPERNPIAAAVEAALIKLETKKVELPIKVKPVVAAAKPAPAPVPAPQLPQVAHRKSISLPDLVQANQARVLVVDAQSLNFGVIVPIAKATATWIGAESKLETKSNSKGIVKAPYPKTRAQRFLINAEGYIPAIGYAVMGSIAVAPMYKADLVAPLVESLALKDFNSHIVLGKALDKNLRPISNVKVDLSQSNSAVNYSLGSWGIFMQGLSESGASGDFVATGLKGTIQYFMPVENQSSEEWPSTIIDLSGAPQVVSVALPKSEREFTQTKVLDAFMLDRPEGQVNLTIGGQRGVYIPDAQGETIIENLFVRPSVDLFEVRAPSYLKSWISTPANPKLMPEFSPLLSNLQVQQLLEPADISWNPEQGVVIGSLQSKDYKEPVQVRVIGPNGRLMRKATVVYFDKHNNASSTIHSTQFNNRFSIVGLGDGEWTLIAVGALTKRGLGSSVVRSSAGVLSFVEL